MIEGFTLLSRSTGIECQRVFEIMKDSLYEFGGGHALELSLKKSKDVPLETYLEIFRMKAASFEGDMEIGALLGGGSPGEVKALAKYGRILGLLAILREEFLDIYDTHELKHRVLSEYLPIPILYAMKDSESKEKIMGILAENINERKVEFLLDIVYNTPGVQGLKNYMDNLLTNALDLTRQIRNKGLRNQLQCFAKSLLEDL
jgi:geranylgeranyl pyrophosphate synthase